MEAFEKQILELVSCLNFGFLDSHRGLESLRLWLTIAHVIWREVFRNSTVRIWRMTTLNSLLPVQPSLLNMLGLTSKHHKVPSTLLKRAVARDLFVVLLVPILVHITAVGSNILGLRAVRIQVRGDVGLAPLITATEVLQKLGLMIRRIIVINSGRFAFIFSFSFSILGLLQTIN